MYLTPWAVYLLHLRWILQAICYCRDQRVEDTSIQDRAWNVSGRHVITNNIFDSFPPSYWDVQPPSHLWIFAQSSNSKLHWSPPSLGWRLVWWACRLVLHHGEGPPPWRHFNYWVCQQGHGKDRPPLWQYQIGTNKERPKSIPPQNKKTPLFPIEKDQIRDKQAEILSPILSLCQSFCQWPFHIFFLCCTIN